MMIRNDSIGYLGAALCIAGFAVGCASPYPAVLTSGPEEVAIEFEIKGSLQGATELANAECNKMGKQAAFSAVEQIATPSTRVAKFDCVAKDAVAPAATPEPTPADETSAEEAPETEEAPATEEPAATEKTAETAE
jgi:hypothetical protein